MIALVLAFALGASNNCQAVSPDVQYLFASEGVIALAQIRSVTVDSAPDLAVWETGTVELDVFRQLRGKPIENKMTVHFGRKTSRQPVRGFLPSPWNGIELKPGEYLLLITAHPRQTGIAAVQLITGPNDPAVAMIEQALALQKADEATLVPHVMDIGCRFLSEVAARALLYADVNCRPGSACRQSIYNDVVAKLGDPKESDKEHWSRLLYEFVFYRSAADSELDNEVVGFAFKSIGNADETVRRGATSFLAGLINDSGTIKPDIDKAIEKQKSINKPINLDLLRKDIDTKKANAGNAKIVIEALKSAER